MNKKIVLIIGIVLLTILTGCLFFVLKDNNTGSIKLDNNYYNNAGYIEISSEEINENTGTYLLFTYNNYCNLPISCDSIFEQFSKKYNIAILKVSFEDFKNTYLYDTVKFAPSIIIVENQKIIDYLDANSDEDLQKYQNVNEFRNWISNYIMLNN